ncbi:MAG TPA: carboxypeptidase regulatory-like domain-containing protein, partial [Vicinamibacterales bacterium]|nr:carboxypeptidase regulatory-like domain-containing protein [Vicinamibacterales bacterium]
MSRFVKLSLAALVAFVVLGTGTAWAQAAIAGVVRDSSGAVIPGVTVEASSPALIEKVRSVVSDGQGQYKIIDLRPGVYEVTFSLAGFTTVKRPGVELTNDFTAQINGDLKPSAVSETITVSGQSPLVDTQTVTQRKSLTSDLIDALPTGRSFQNLSVLVPGVQTGLGSQDVGGTQGDRYQTLSVHGSRADQMPLIMNGMPYNNMNNTGGGYNTTLVVNTGTVQEMTVTTSGLTAEARSSGVLTNVVPKEGGNTYRGEFFGNFANGSMQSSNLTAALIAQNLIAVPKVKRLDDVNPVFGGPIVRDRLWYFGGFRVDQAQSYVANGFVNNNIAAPQYCIPKTGATTCTYNGVTVPDSRNLNQQAVAGDTWSRGETVNFTYQATQRNKFTAFAHFNQRLVDCNGCSATTSPESGTYFTHRPEYLLQSTWTNPLTSKLLLEGGFTFYNERWIFGPEPYNNNGYAPGANISKTESSLGVTYGSGNVFTTAANHQYNFRWAANYVTGSHAIKFGVTDMWGTRNYQYDTNDAYAESFVSGVPSQITEYARPLIDTEHVKAALATYAQDRWTIKRLTLNLGVRFDYHNAYVPAQNLAAIPFLPARNYPEIDNVPNWKDISPRLGGAFDIFGNGRTVARVNFAKYVQSESTNMATLNNPVNTTINSATRTWTDSNGNFIPDCNLTNIAAQDLSGSGGDKCGALNSPLGSLNVAAAYSPSITSGWGVRPNDHEVSFGLQHALTHRLAADAQFTRHSFGNFFASYNSGRPPSDYNLFCATAPTGQFNGNSLPNAGQQICGFADLNPAFFSTVPFYQVQKASNFGNVSDVYTGYDVNLTARLPRGGQLSGGTSIGHEITDVCGIITQAT